MYVMYVLYCTVLHCTALHCTVLHLVEEGVLLLCLHHLGPPGAQLQHGPQHVHGLAARLHLLGEGGQGQVGACGHIALHR